MIRIGTQKQQIIAGFVLAMTLFSIGQSYSQNAHTEAYQLGISLQESFRKGDPSLFAKTFDRDAFLKRVIDPIKISDAQRENLRTNLESQVAPEDIGEAVHKNGRSFTFVGVRRFQNEYQLLFRIAGPNNGLAYYGYPIGKSASGPSTIVDILCFAPPELMSATIRRRCLVVIASVTKSAVEEWTAKEKDFVDSQADWNAFVEQCQAGRHAIAEKTYAKLPASLNREPFILYQRGRVARQEDESVFLDAISNWQRERPEDPALQLLLCDYYLPRNRLSEAVAAYEKLNDELGGDPELDVRIAKLHASLNHTNEARTHLWEAVHRDPPDAAAFAELLKWNLLQRNFEEAASVLTLQEKVFRADLKPAIRSDERFHEFRQSLSGRKWLKGETIVTSTGPAGVATRLATETLKLQAIVFGTATPSALINGKTLFVQDKIGSYQVIRIEPQSVTLRSSTGDARILALGAGP